MLVYRDAHSRESTGRLLAGMLQRRDATSAQELRDLIVDYGELESALVDAACPELDRTDAFTVSLRRIGRALASSFVACRRAASQNAREFYDNAYAELEQLRSARELPDTIKVKPAEGFVQYAVFPEQYSAAADELWARFQPSRCVIIGLRTIGACLSSVVEATLARHGSHVSSLTLRPRGHPFDRVIRAEPDLEHEVSQLASALFVVVDEGPGLSASSFASVVRFLRSLGVRSEAIVLMPSYVAARQSFVNADAGRAFSACVRIAAPFTTSWIGLAPGAKDWTELSAGRWRAVLPGQLLTAVSSDSRFCGTARLVTHPQHERRKFLLSGDGPAALRIRRFAALGWRGNQIWERAALLQSSGVTPHVHGYHHGLLELAAPRGTCLRPRRVCSEHMQEIAKYVAFRRCELALPTQSDGALLEMARLNATSLLAREHGAAVERLWRAAQPACSHVTLVDARMLAHEWLVTERGRLVKVDAFDHADDHFFPGPCDAAWDIAAAIIELEFSGAAAGELLHTYAARSGDRVEPKLPFFIVAYLAFRGAYCRIAAQTLTETPDGRGFELQARRYRALLRQALARAAA